MVCSTQNPIMQPLGDILRLNLRTACNGDFCPSSLLSGQLSGSGLNGTQFFSLFLQFSVLGKGSNTIGAEVMENLLMIGREFKEKVF